MREVRIKDTLSGELVALDPSEEVGIYACGPTVYSRIHIGNARPFVVFSLLARFLSRRDTRRSWSSTSPTSTTRSTRGAGGGGGVG